MESRLSPQPQITWRLALGALVASAVACAVFYFLIGESGLLLAPIVAGVGTLIVSRVIQAYRLTPADMEELEAVIQRRKAEERGAAVTSEDAAAFVAEPSVTREAAVEARNVAKEWTKSKRARSSGTRKMPQGIGTAASKGFGPPKVGDKVQVKVGGVTYDAGTLGTVVDVFSAGVIIELSDKDGHAEKIKLPFEAFGLDDN